MIEITHIKWDGMKIGIALHKMKEGINEIQVTAKNKNGELYYPNPIFIDKQKVLGKYGVEIINKNNLLGVWLPLKDFCV